MNRSLAALAAAAMLAASLPSVGFADDAATSTTSASGSTVVEKGPDWMKPCLALTGLLKAQCIAKHNPGKGNKKDRVTRRGLVRAVQIASDCADKEGQEKIECIRQNGRRGIKHLVRKAAKTDLLRTIRGKLQSSSSSSASSED